MTAGVLEFVPLEVTRLYVPPTEEMDLDELDLNPRILAAVKKGILIFIKTRVKCRDVHTHFV